MFLLLYFYYLLKNKYLELFELYDKYVELNKFVIFILNVVFIFKYKKGFLMCILNIN